mmetsp:Transcript_37587/g.88936  ORF Transcript_37587/g.88936 Transcript_37587/m.88936 type:complete len:85 (-) Transcript_37587:34-288(-)
MLYALATMHVQGNYLWRDYCGVMEGPDEAVGDTVSYMGKTVKVEAGSCPRIEMAGSPYMTRSPDTFTTDSAGHLLEWDGKVWSI